MIRTCVRRLLIGSCLTGAAVLLPMAAAAKTPGKTYCFVSTCHRVLTLAETAALVGKPRSMIASHYDDPRVDRFNPSRITSSGELFRPGEANNAASPIFPDGTLVAVFAPSTRRGAIVRINNAGPYWGNRLIDLSRGLADRLGVGGVSRVTVEVLAAPTAAEARYKRGRRYPPVAGFIGRVASVEEVRAHWDAGQVGSRTLLAAAPSTPAPVALAAAEIPFLPDPARTDSFPEPKLAAHRPGLIAPTPPAADQPADPAATPTTPAAAAFVASQSAPAPAADRVVREIKGAVAADLPIRPGTSAARLEQD